MAIKKETLGAAIKRVRIARRLTQVQLAEAAGLSKGGNSIALVEQGKRFVSVDTLNAIADALDVPAACLAILGSHKIGTNKAATDFMHSLQKVILAVVDAQESIQGGDNGVRSKGSVKDGIARRRSTTRRTKARAVAKRRDRGRGAFERHYESG